jgi:hypothetical protein
MALAGTARAGPCREAVRGALAALPGVDAGSLDLASEAIESASTGPRSAARLVVVGYWESRFLGRIQAGQCRSFRVRGQWQHECDGYRLRDGTVVYKARSWWQMQEVVPEWPRILGLEPEPAKLAARAANRMLERGYRMCRTERGAISAYAIGHCGWAGAHRRAAWVERIAPRLTACGGRPGA